MSDDGDGQTGPVQNGGNGERKREETGMRDPGTGKFLPGHPPTWGGGRPPGTMDLMTICRRKAKELGVDLEELVWAVVRALSMRAAKTGDPMAAKLLLDRFCGMLERGPIVNVGVDARNVQVGPPTPKTRELAAYLKELGETAEELLAADKERKEEKEGKDGKEAK